MKCLIYFLACNCDTYGTDDISCSSDGICNCIEGYDGDKCELCAEGYYHTSTILQTTDLGTTNHSTTNQPSTTLQTTDTIGKCHGTFKILF